MRILNGWKEIAECLHRTTRSVRRWERLGLPVRRVSSSPRSPIIAFSDELEDWARKRTRIRMSEFDLETNYTAFGQKQRDASRLIGELKLARIEQRRLLRTLREQIAKGEAIQAKMSDGL